MKKVLLSSLIASSMVFPVMSYAKPPIDHPPHKGAPAHPGPKGPHGGPMMHKGEPHMHMAQKLAAMETAIGIRSDQLDSWRKYTSSLMDMMAPPPPAETDAKNKTLLYGEPMADHAIARAEKAKTFKEAAAKLRKILDAKQIERMTAFSHHKGPHPEADGVKPPKPE